MAEIKITKTIRVGDGNVCGMCRYCEFHNDIHTDSWCGYCKVFDKLLVYGEDNGLLRCEDCKKAEVKDNGGK